MAYLDSRSFWRLVAAQHGVVAHRQLIALGLHPQAVKRRIRSGRLHRVWRGVYAVGRPDVGQRGRWMGAALACGDGALLGGESAATLMAMDGREGRGIQLVVARDQRCSHPGIEPRRSQVPPAHRGTIDGIPVTSPARTLVDLARTRSRHDLETAINEADKLGLIDPEALRALLPEFAGLPGVAKLRRTLDVRTFVLTEAGVERHFLPVARRAGLRTLPLTQQRVNGYLVDFHWPALGLVVETDGLRYHRTPGKQAADLRRQQTHLTAGYWPLRFSHGQVAFEKGYVEEALRDMVARIAGNPGTAGST